MLVGGALAVMMLAGLVFRAAARPAHNPYPTTYSKSAFGFAGLFELLKRLDVPCGKWRRPFTSLYGSDFETLVISFPQRRSISQREAEALESWVRRGNTLVVLYSGLASPAAVEASEAVLGEMLGAAPSQARSRAEVEDFWLPRVGARSLSRALSLWSNRDAPSLAVEESARPLRLKGDMVFLPLFVWEGQPYVVEGPFGKGSAIVSASAAPFWNSFILKQDNLAFALNLAHAAAASGGIYFDEYHQGHEEAFTAGDLFKSRAFAAAAAICGVTALLFVLSKGRRFGPARPVERYSRRSTLEYVNSVAELYRRGRFRRHAMEVLARAFQRRLARRGLAVEVREGGGPPRWRGVLAQAAEQASEKAQAVGSDDEMAATVREMDQTERKAAARRVL